MEAHERYTKKMLRKLEAHLKGKRTKVTWYNAKGKAVTTTGMEFWGDPKARFDNRKNDATDQ